MLQELHGLYLAENEQDAMAALDRFFPPYVDDPLPDFYKVVDTLFKWAPEIFAFHRTERIGGGRLEENQEQAGRVKRMAFGFVNASNFEARAISCLSAKTGSLMTKLPKNCAFCLVCERAFQ